MIVHKLINLKTSLFPLDKNRAKLADEIKHFQTNVNKSRCLPSQKAGITL